MSYSSCRCLSSPIDKRQTHLLVYVAFLLLRSVVVVDAMIYSIHVEIRLSGFPSTIVQVRVPLKPKSGDDKPKSYFGEGLEPIEARTLLGQISQVYAEERAVDKSLPELPDMAYLVLVQGEKEFEATDNMSGTLDQLSHYSSRHTDPEDRLAVIDTRERKSERVRRVVDESPESRMQIIAGGIGSDDHYVVVQLPSTNERVVCLRQESALTEFLRSAVVRNDERLFERNRSRTNSRQRGNHRNEGKKSSMEEFTIRFRLSEFARHAHKIIKIAGKINKDRESATSNDEENTPNAQQRSKQKNDELSPECVDADAFIKQPKAAQSLETEDDEDYQHSRHMYGAGAGTWEQLEDKVKLSLVSLARFLQDELLAMHAQWQDIFENGRVSFDSLVVFLGIGTEVVTKSNDGFLQGGRVTELDFLEKRSNQNNRPVDLWQITVQTVSSNGVRFSPVLAKLYVEDFRPKLMPVHELDLRPISEDERRMLTQRGRIYRDLAVGAHHKAYLGPMRISAFRTMRADGRIMVDVERYYIHTAGSVPQYDGTYEEEVYWERRQHHRSAGLAHSAFQEKATEKTRNRSSTQETKGDMNEDSLFDPLDDSLLWMTPPSLPAFSFRHHQFGSCHIELMSDIVWREEAWEQLVLPEVKKDLIRALVLQTRSQAEVDVLERQRWATTRLMNTTSHKNSGAKEAKDIDQELVNEMDIVQGKGGGCTMLLHGRSGTGKTLTAEAVSELLKRPLYSVTVGELGTTPTHLESKLNEVLDLAACWRAIILLDEADVFLAKRRDDIGRNGLVSIFLRTIEYFNGVLILTSNLADKIDAAFESRIHVSLHYDDLGPAERAKVWHNFLGKLPGSSFDYDKLATYDLNGRQIRSAVRVSRALAQDRQQPVSQHIIERVITQTMQD